MLSTELINLARHMEDADRLKAGRPVDTSFIASKLRTIAEGVTQLEAITVPDHARVVPSEVRRQALGENVLAFEQTGGAS